MSQPAPQPNVLFFFADDQRFDTIEALGNPHIHTPNLDALVERGVAFTHAHVMGGRPGRSAWPVGRCCTLGERCST